MQCCYTVSKSFLVLVQDMERPLYMQPKDALEYNVIDGIVKPQTDIIDSVKKAEAWCVAASALSTSY